MSPEIKVKGNKIYIKGHYSDQIKCAKLSLLCKIYDADIYDGEAELPFSQSFMNDLNLIDDSLYFACDNGGCSTSCSGGCSGCGGSCAKGCSKDCGDCGSSCGDKCKGKCRGKCKGCSGGCKGDCSGNCSGNCDNGCKQTSLAETYSKLITDWAALSDSQGSTIIKQKINATLLTEMAQLILNEHSRRLDKATTPYTPVTPSSISAGTEASHDLMDKMLQDLQNMPATSVELTSQALAEGSMIRETGEYLHISIRNYLRDISNLYNEIVHAG